MSSFVFYSLPIGMNNLGLPYTKPGVGSLSKAETKNKEKHSSLSEINQFVSIHWINVISINLALTGPIHSVSLL